MNRIVVLTSPKDPVRYEDFGKKSTCCEFCEAPEILSKRQIVVCAPFLGNVLEDESAPADASTDIEEGFMRDAVAKALWKHVVLGGKVLLLLTGRRQLEAIKNTLSPQVQEPGWLLHLMWKKGCSVATSVLHLLAQTRHKKRGRKRRRATVPQIELESLPEQVGMTALSPELGAALQGLLKDSILATGKCYYLEFDRGSQRTLHSLAWWGKEQFPILAGVMVDDGIILVTLCPDECVTAGAVKALFDTAEPLLKAMEVTVLIIGQQIIFQQPGREPVRIGTRGEGRSVKVMLYLIKQVKAGQVVIPVEEILSHLSKTGYKCKSRRIDESDVKMSIRDLWTKYIKRVYDKGTAPQLAVRQGVVHVRPLLASALKRARELGRKQDEKMTVL
ncbi:MAG: hypothetical protein DRP82_01440 [Planctomycetota bacterium]|nr:MAG: hypothetical protein DRP82_01440 [Planctomycetota bacterium]